MTADVKIIQYNIFPFKKKPRLSSESVDRFSVIIKHTQPALKSSCYTFSCNLVTRIRCYILIITSN